MRRELIRQIKEYSIQIRNRRIESLFLKKDRSLSFSLEASGLSFDFSKTNLDDNLLSLLKSFLKESNFLELRDDLFNGGKVNVTESKPALHSAIRSNCKALVVDGSDVKKELSLEYERMVLFCQKVLDGELTGSTGKVFTDIVNIGIGGSQTGPEMIIKALKSFKSRLAIHFMSSIDPAESMEVLETLNPETTLFVVVSKSFKTLETLTNAKFVESWLKKNLKSEEASHAHMVAVSSNWDNIENSQVSYFEKFRIHDFVGGRYSLWGAAGISIMLGLGVSNFKEILNGADSMDIHFQSEEIEHNIPALLGLIGTWHCSFCDYRSIAIIPYEKRLEIFPKYIQQLHMESNGKSVEKSGGCLKSLKSPIVWGDIGTNSQHSFFQYLHQGQQVVPCEFIVGRESSIGSSEEQHNLLKLNCIAQGEALMVGHTSKSLLSHEIIKGNRPSMTIVYNKLEPFALGALCALYEHKVFVEGVLLSINSFDQFGVERGKNLVNRYRSELNAENLKLGENSIFSNFLFSTLFKKTK